MMNLLENPNGNVQDTDTELNVDTTGLNIENIGLNIDNRLNIDTIGSSIGSCECGTCLRFLVFLTFRFDVEIFLQFSEENSIDENIVVVFLII
jgi:hypothetical protein